MAQYVPGERVNPEDVLNRVAKHRLFPHAEASLRLHIPHVQKYFSLGLQVRPSITLPPRSESAGFDPLPFIHPPASSQTWQGPNPYAAMAIILVLSENVGDVQSLVSLLAGCMSTTAIKEYLTRTATLLLAIMRNEIRISNRCGNWPLVVQPATLTPNPLLFLTTSSTFFDFPGCTTTFITCCT